MELWHFVPLYALILWAGWKKEQKTPRKTRYKRRKPHGVRKVRLVAA
jgi:hypothetical protein